MVGRKTDIVITPDPEGEGGNQSYRAGGAGGLEFGEVRKTQREREGESERERETMRGTETERDIQRQRERWGRLGWLGVGGGRRQKVLKTRSYSREERRC